MAKNMMRQLERRRRMQEAEVEANALAVKRWEAFATRHDIVMLYTLHKDFGFGAKRLEKFYLNMIYHQIEMIKQFRANVKDDDTHYLVMAERLKQAGVDIDDLLSAKKCWYKVNLVKRFMIASNEFKEIIGYEDILRKREEREGR